MSVCDWCLREVDDRHRVPADDPADLDDMVCRDCGVEHAPIDWPARFRAAADVAATGGAYQLRALATWLEQQPPSRVAAIGQELLGEGE